MKIKATFILAILIPILSILLQGCYFNLQVATILCMLGFLILADKPRISKAQLLCIGTIITGLIISDVLYGNIHNSLFEISKLSFLFLPLFLSDKNSKNGLLLGLYIGACMASVVGLTAYVLHYDKYELVRNIDGIRTVQGSIGYANTMAVFCGIGLILSIYYFRKNENYIFLNELLFGINGICLVMTGSKLGMLSLAFAIIIALCFKYKKIIPYVLGGLATAIVYVAVLFALGKERIILGSTLACRLIYWHDAISVFIKNPLGAGVYGWQGLQYKIQTANYSVKYVHNGFLQVALDGGILSFLGVVFILVTGMVTIANRYLKEQKEFYLYLLAILLLVSAHSFVDIDFAYGAVWLSLGIALSFVKRDEIKINKYIVFALCLLISANCIFAKVNNTNRAEMLANEFSVAYKNKDFEKMYKVSRAWVTEAPRQQYAYDAFYLSLASLNMQDELDALYKEADNINKTMNVLCKYLTQHQKIILPQRD